MQLNEAIRELWRSWVGKAGLVLLITLFVGAGYVLATYPLDYGDRTWSNPTIWVDNPKAAAPTWTNLWRREPEPEHLVLTAGAPDEVREATAGKLETYRLAFFYDYAQPPTFLAITLGDVLYAERPPLINVSLLRPDGKEVRLLRHAVRGPREGEQGPFERYITEPLRIQLSTDESTIGGLQEFLADQFELQADARDLRGVVDRALFGTPTAATLAAGTSAGDGLTFTPLTGEYTVIIQAAFRDPADQMGLVRFVAGGAVYGLMGTDTLGRDLAEGLLFG
ncbi:MAG: hypothetical protein KDE53_29485, partial [Caldilineaceae bacterium]|nr:hypothetical protein [Caldilineaceae bacterium]